MVLATRKLVERFLTARALETFCVWYPAGWLLHVFYGASRVGTVQGEHVCAFVDRRRQHTISNVYADHQAFHPFSVSYLTVPVTARRCSSAYAS